MSQVEHSYGGLYCEVKGCRGPCKQEKPTKPQERPWIDNCKHKGPETATKGANCDVGLLAVVCVDCGQTKRYIHDPEVCDCHACKPDIW